MLLDLIPFINVILRCFQVWTDLGMIMGLEEDVKEHVLHKIRHTYREEVCPDDDKRAEPADKDGEF